MDESDIRLNFHNKLSAAFPDLRAYYRPSGNKILTRPCIVYEPRENEPSFANNRAFTIGVRYQVTILSDTPGYFDKNKMYEIEGITISGNNSFTNEDIVHDVFHISVNSIR